MRRWHQAVWLPALALAVLCAAGCKKKNIYTESVSGPVLEYDWTKLDLGVVPQDATPAKFRLPIRNVGGESLVIRRLDIGCSCLSASVLPEVIPPGEEGSLTLLAGRSKFGENEAQITLHTNVVSRPVEYLTVRWEVNSGYRVEPELVLVGRVEPGKPRAFEFAVVDESTGEPVTMTSRDDLKLVASGSVQFVKLEDWDHGVRGVLNVPSQPRSENFQVTFELVSGSRRLQESRLVWRVQPRLELVPCELDFVAADIGQPKRVWLRLDTTENLPNAAVEVDSPPSVRVDRVDEGADWKLFHVGIVDDSGDDDDQVLFRLGDDTARLTVHRKKDFPPMPVDRSPQ